MYDHARVTTVTPQVGNANRSFRVDTVRGSLTAKEVLLATGAYSTDAVPALQKKLIPIGSYIIATEVLPAELARELSPRNRMIYDSKHFLYYYRLTPDNRMLFGGRAAFFPESESTVRESAELLRRGMIEVYPQLAQTKVEFVWGGTLDFGCSTLCRIPEVRRYVFRDGFCWPRRCCRDLDGCEARQRDLRRPGRQSIFQRFLSPGAPIGLRSGNAWALPLAGAYYKVLDWLT